MAKRQQMASPVSEFLGVLMVAGIVLFGGSMIINHEGSLTAEHFILYIAMFSQIMRPAKAISDSFSNIHAGIAAGERVLALIDEKPQINNMTDAVELTDFKDKITFDNVFFAYKDKVDEKMAATMGVEPVDNDKSVLKNLNLSIPKGKTVALVGPSGGGKTTMMDLLPRFIEPQAGVIAVDGMDIRRVTMESLRALMGIVNQESILFNDTIFNNITFWAEPTPENQKRFNEILRMASLSSYVDSLPEKELTRLGDNGILISGGQRQRISIARELYKDTEVLIFDEATSALDSETEKIIQENIEQLHGTYTIVLIAHRLSTIKEADTIYLLEKGKVTASGSFDEMVHKSTRFKKMVSLQGI
jgi:subfamily B ATP-binding cassette protein MsbA